MSGHGIDVDRDMIAGWAEKEHEQFTHYRGRSALRRRQACNWVWYSILLCAVGLAFPIIYAAVALGYVLYGVWRYMAWKLESQALAHEAEYIKWRDIKEVW